MHGRVAAILLMALATVGFAQVPSTSAARSGGAPRPSLVEFELMTWPEVKAALAAGKTTALFYTGGTEQRGPQNVNGGHTLMGRVIVRTIAERLGNAIAMPVLPYTPATASRDLPGTIGLTPELLGAILDRVSEQAIATGFRNVILMGDHGGGQPDVYRNVASKLDAKHSATGVHVYFCDAVYAKAQADFDAWLDAHGYPPSSHGGIPDTSMMLYLGGDKGWVRKDLIPTAEGKNLGITGDARRSTAELGKQAFDIKIDYAVQQIRAFLAGPTTPR